VYIMAGTCRQSRVGEETTRGRRLVADTGWEIGVADRAGFGFSFYSHDKALMRVAARASAGGFAVGIGYGCGVA
jgi:hypothetical protein